MVTLYFHLQPQYKYELFHIYLPWFHCTGRYELNKLTLLPMYGFIAQLVEHRTGIAEVLGSNPVEALIFFRLLLSNCLNSCYYSYQRFDMQTRRKGQFCFVLTRSPRLHAFWNKRIFDRRRNCNNSYWKIYCDNHTLLSSTTAVQIWIISYISPLSVAYTWKKLRIWIA